MTLIAIAVILFSTILLILCLPVTYEIKVHIGPPSTWLSVPVGDGS